MSAAPHAEPAGSLAPVSFAEGVLQALPRVRAWIWWSVKLAGVRRCRPSGGARALIEVEAGLVAQLARDLRLALVQAAHCVDEREGEVLLEAQQRRVVLLRAAAGPSASALVLFNFSACMISVHWLQHRMLTLTVAPAAAPEP